ncbi:UTP--glucose-1-phosphate uridylyltransferase [Alkalihalophilus pseudofirmus]|uniref:UTP--glucose-1-phosphate uridylyltransferase GalU n=1 Tax=Alkalihalophilus pseudofirmus TaxID=79885 RepID=UPI0009530713|nr:UTP--glucose-1-phosphate uridylyltransferase [Alkalihalophilus pseudofirmus]
MNVRKAIIPAAGLGTRFLPATKAQPKEMLPIVDKPTIQFIVEEAVASGIEDIIIVSGRGKRAIEDHFDKSYELEETLAKREKWDVLEEMSSISNLANIHYIRQKEPLGLGHAILCASRFIGDEPFAVLLGDDVVRGEPPCLSQLMNIYERHPCSIVGVQKVAYEEVTKYGIIEPTGTALEPRLMALRDLIEKPTVEEAPSRYAIQGRYILHPEIFPILERVAPGAGGEIQLTDAIRQLNKEQTVLAYEFSGKRYDVGDKAGYLKATIDFALEREELREELLAYMESIIQE